MIIRCQAPRSKAGEKLQRMRPLTMTKEMRRVSEIWGRASQPGVSKVSTHYRERKPLARVQKLG
jgi:hypothetical protein